MGMHLPAGEDPRRYLHVLQPPVGAGADDHLVYLHLSRLGDGLDVGGQVREGYLGLQSAHVELQLLDVGRVHIALEHVVLAAGPSLQPPQRLLVHVEDAVLGPGLHRHIGHGEPAVHGKVFNGRTAELHGTITSTVHPDLPYGEQDEVLAPHPGSEFSRISELHRRRYPQPDLSQGHGHGQVGGAHPGGKSPQGAVGTGVGVGSHDDLSRQHQALLRQKHVLDAHPAHLEIVLYLLLQGEGAYCGALLGGTHVPRGCEVVGHQRHL